MLIKNKIAVFAIASMVSMAFAGVFSFQALRGLNSEWRSYTQSIETRRKRLISMYGAAGYGRGIHAFKNLVLRGRLADAVTAKAGLDTAITIAEEYKRDPECTPLEATAVTTFADTMREYLVAVDLAARLVATGATPTMIDRYVSIDDSEAVHGIRVLTQTLDDLEKAATETLGKKQRALFLSMGVGFGTLILVCLGWALSIGRSIGKGMEALVRSAQRFAGGHLETPLETSGQDEIAQLATAMETMRGHLNNAIDGLKSSNVELERFAFVASHDLREPLRKITLLSGMIVEDASSATPEQLDRYVRELATATQRMEQLIADLLDYSRVDRHDEVHQVDLETLVGEVLDDLAATIQGVQAQISFHSLPSVLGNKTALRQLVQNLLSNAMKFREPNMAPIISISADKSGSRCLITVEDKGIGLDMKHSEQIFGAFQRLHTVQKYPGTGLGLALCRKIVQQHGGTISVQSRPGAGAKFRFDLPLADSAT